MLWCCRDLKEILDSYEQGKPFYLYTGRVRQSAVPAAGLLCLLSCSARCVLRHCQQRPIGRVGGC